MPAKNYESGIHVKVKREVTFAFIALNLIVAIHEYRMTPVQQYLFEHRFALSLEGVRAGGWWQFLTYQFLHAKLEFQHAGFVHLFVNILFLDSLGPVLETTLGRVRFA